MYVLFCCAIDSEEADDLTNATTLTVDTATLTTVTATTAATAANDNDGDNDDVSVELLRLHVSPQPNENGELVRAVGSSVVFTCQRVIGNVDGDDLLTAEATTIEWFDKNDMRIPSQTSHG